MATGDDSAFELLTRLLATRDHSVYELKMKLARRFDPQLIEHVLEGEAELDKMRHLLERRFGSVSDMDRETHAKAYRFLRFRGFADRWIRQVLK
jgi:SOS response regulatory protein OraA/RecX